MSKKMQSCYQGSVILRMFEGDMKKMQEFHEDYKENCATGTRRGQTPSKEEFAIAKDWLQLGTTATAKKYNYSAGTVDYIVNRVARYQMKHE